MYKYKTRQEKSIYK